VLKGTLKFTGAAASGLVAAGLLSAPAGEAVTVPPPHIDAVNCAANCKHGKVRNGSTVKLLGNGFTAVTKVVFLGGKGKTDDLSVDVTPTSDTALDARVPFGAMSGPLEAWDTVKHSDPSKSVTIHPPPSPASNGKFSQAHGPTQPDAPTFETATDGPTVYFGSHGASFSYRLDTGGPAAVTVSLVRLSDDNVIRSWSRSQVATGIVKSFHWNATIDGKEAPDTRYAFRMTATGPTGAESHNASLYNLRRDAFDLHGYVFPVHGSHTYGDGFGVPRPGHKHMGVDVLAPCGTPLLAARGGVVKAKGYQASAAGNYVVVDGSHTGYDFFYAHLRSSSSLSQGAHVLTGQQIGVVGQTGDATACHLHFEMHTAPGWHTGGHAFDPLHFLKTWDAYS
jgi:hypothetical protein